jgi:hypothetical protein
MNKETFVRGICDFDVNNASTTDATAATPRLPCAEAHRGDQRRGGRRRLKTAEGEAGRITLSPPGSQDRTERELLLNVLEITDAEFIARFTRTVQTDWRLTIKPLQFRQVA